MTPPDLIPVWLISFSLKYVQIPLDVRINKFESLFNNATSTTSSSPINFIHWIGLEYLWTKNSFKEVFLIWPFLLTIPIEISFEKSSTTIALIKYSFKGKFVR